MSVASRSDAPGLRPKALVTGIAGFTGRYVAVALETAGYEVHGLTHAGGGHGHRVMAVDLADRDALKASLNGKAFDTVVHLAAISFVAHGDADAIYRTNIVGTRNLLEALAEVAERPRIVILASSANIYGNAEVEPIHENVPPAPANDYAVSKLAMECMARLWMDRLPIVVTRPFNYTGVGQGANFLIPKIVGHFQRREPVIELGNLRVWRDFSDVRDIARAYLHLAQAAPADGVFNLCSGNAYSLEEVLAMMTAISGHQLEVRVNPAFVRANEVVRLVGDRSRLQGVGGALPVTSFRETLEWMYRADPV